MRRQLINGVVNRIRLVGIELEGGWSNAVPGYDIIRDGSLKFEKPKQDYWINPQTLRKEPKGTVDLKPYPRLIGEIVSPAIEVPKVEEWVTPVYPQFVNETCGLHIHMSFYNKLNYSRTMTPEYMDQIIRELKAWGEANNIPKDHMFWKRLDPNHPWTLQHCSHEFLADKQVLMKRKDYNSRGTEYSRYTFINYCEGQHHTVECRGLPMFEEAKTAVSALNCVIDTTNRFLSKIKQRERGVKATVAVRPPAYEEIGTVVV